MTDQLELAPAMTPADQLVVRVRFRTLHVEGEIDANTADRFETSLRFAFELGDPVCVDMSRVSFLGSSGIRALLRASEDRPVVIVHPSLEVRHVIGLLDLDDHFGITDQP